MSTKYSYTVSQTANNKVDVGSLTQEIQNSSIVKALDKIDVIDTALDIYFKQALATADQTTLTTVVGAHTGAPLPDIQTVLPDVATLADPTKEVQRVVVQPGRSGYYMCDRDIRLSTAMVAADAAFEDLKVNVSDSKQLPWGEMEFMGCYKLVGTDYVECSDQTDADANAVLSVYSFIAKNQTTDAAIEYDFKGGCLWSDASLTGDVWAHRMYAVMAPNIPSSMGGSIRFFDGYLYPYQGKWQEAVNSLALKIDPAATVEAARIMFWIYYPAGAKQNHVLRFITYRKPETF